MPTHRFKQQTHFEEPNKNDFKIKFNFFLLQGKRFGRSSEWQRESPSRGKGFPPVFNFQQQQQQHRKWRSNDHRKWPFASSVDGDDNNNDEWNFKELRQRYDVTCRPEVRKTDWQHLAEFEIFCFENVSTYGKSICLTRENVSNAFLKITECL
jgi:hypothetical protein